MRYYIKYAERPSILSEEFLLELELANRKVLIISTSSPKYIRTRQLHQICMAQSYSCRLLAPGDGDEVRPLSLRRLIALIMRLLFHTMGTYDVVVIAGVPQLVMPFIAFRTRDKVLILDYFISLYNTLVNDRNTFSQRNPAARVLKWLDKFALRRADVVVTDTLAHEKYYRKLYGIDDRQYKVLYLEPDLSVYNKDSTPFCFSDDEAKYKVLFFGTDNPLQGFSFVRDSIRLLSDNDDILFVLIGPSSLSEGLPESKNWIHLSDWMSQEELCSVILGVDLVLVGHFSSDIKKASIVIPGKAYICNSLGTKFILGDSPAVRERFDLFQARAVLVERGSSQAIIEGILKGYAHWKSS